MSTPTRFLSTFLERLPHFTPDQERAFQEEYYARVLPTLRLASLLLAGLTAVQSALHPHGFDLDTIPQLIFWLGVFGATWLPVFARVWQPLLVVLSWASAAIVLGGASRLLGPQFAGLHFGGGPPPGVSPLPGAGGAAGMAGMAGAAMDLPPTIQQQEFAFMLQLAVLMVTLSTLRLGFRQTVLLQAGVLIIGFASAGAKLSADPHPDRLAYFVVLPGIIVLLVLLLVSFTQEQLARRAFWAGHLLAEERNSERREREQTQGQLRVLAQAIGGIVHDLGSPLTVVQMSASFWRCRVTRRPMSRRFATRRRCSTPCACR